MDEGTRHELEATVQARRELGPEHDEHLISGFLERIEKEIDRRVDEKLASRSKGRKRNIEAELGIFVPLFIIAGIFAGVAGILTTAAALVVVFLVQTFRP
jgi:hypothetical protein